MAKREPHSGSLKEIAEALFFSGCNQQTIADKVGVSRQTIGKWIKEECWAQRRAAKTASRKEIVSGMLNRLDEMVASGTWGADEIAKIASAIEKIDKQTNIITVMEVFSLFDSWLMARMSIDSELTPELIKAINRYQDLFISEKLNAVQLNDIG